MHFTLRQNPLRHEHLENFVRAYNPENRHERAESERSRPFSYDELLQRDKVSLDLIWLRDESLEDSENLPPPEVLAQEIAEDLEAALAEFAQIAARGTSLFSAPCSQHPAPARRATTRELRNDDHSERGAYPAEVAPPTRGSVVWPLYDPASVAQPAVRRGLLGSR
jgi:hypothetical protein